MALIEAAGAGHAETVRVLLSYGGDPRARRGDGMRALDHAAQGGHGEIVALLLTRDPGLLDLPGYRERTALMAAVGAGHTALVAWLLTHGADPRLRMRGGARALDLAASMGRPAILQQLLAHDPGLVALPGHQEDTALHVAAGRGQAAAVGVLLAHGADPRTRLAQGGRALGRAASRGQLAVVELLLAHDPALLDLSGDRDSTALMAAAAGGHLPVLDLLLNRGADPRRRGAAGVHALDSAAQEGHEEVCERLPGLRAARAGRPQRAQRARGSRRQRPQGPGGAAAGPRC